MEATAIMPQMMVQYQKKYSIISELHRLTQELADTLSYNDYVSTQLVLAMRQEEILKADECSVAISVLESTLEPSDRQRLHDVLHEILPPNTFEEKKVLELYKNIQISLERTIEIDKRANRKIAGKDSFYQTKK